MENDTIVHIASRTCNIKPIKKHDTSNKAVIITNYHAYPILFRITCLPVCILWTNSNNNINNNTSNNIYDLLFARMRQCSESRKIKCTPSMPRIWLLQYSNYSELRLLHSLRTTGYQCASLRMWFDITYCLQWFIYVDICDDETECSFYLLSHMFCCRYAQLRELSGTSREKCPS